MNQPRLREVSSRDSSFQTLKSYHGATIALLPSEQRFTGIRETAHDVRAAGQAERLAVHHVSVELCIKAKAPIHM